MQTQLYTTFVALNEAFGTVNRDGFRKMMRKFGCPGRFVHTLRQLHDGMMARITDNDTVLEAFAMTNEVKQGCGFVSTLFNLVSSAVLVDAYSDVRPGIRIAYRPDGHLLNSRRMLNLTRLFTATVYDLPFAVDCVLRTATEADMRRSLYPFAAGCAHFGPTTNTDKTVIMPPVNGPQI
nr:unnamed protein product [Spirometra erinaceieuropaei]